MKNSQEGFRIFLTMKIIQPEKQKRLKKSDSLKDQERYHCTDRRAVKEKKRDKRIPEKYWLKTLPI